jgi:membrane-associated phospholipid phosphatase
MKPTVQPTIHSRLLNIIFSLALLIFMVIAVSVSVYPENSFDSYIRTQTHFLSDPGLLPFWIRLTFLGSFEFLFPAWIIFILIISWKRKIRYGLSVAGLAIGGFLSVQWLKQIFHRHRPPTPLIPNVIDYSFPSGHSTSSLIFCAVLIYGLWHSNAPRYLRIAGVILLMLLIGSIGLSRIVLALHYPTDVVAGFCIGTIWLIIWYRFIHQNLTG